MTDTQIDEQYDDYDDDVGFCYDCYGGGWKLSCPDDMCHGTYEGGPWAPCGDDRCVRPCKSCNKRGYKGF